MDIKILKNLKICLSSFLFYYGKSLNVLLMTFEGTMTVFVYQCLLYKIGKITYTRWTK